MIKITVIKQNLEGEETWRYEGTILDRGDNWILLEARFNYPQEVDIQGLVLRSGDRFIEIFYTNKWYNIFEVHDRDDDQLKGWYCNIGTPAQINDSTVSYRDLALDLIVFPDGKQEVVDQEEFKSLGLSPFQRSQAIHALSQLQAIFRYVENEPFKMGRLSGRDTQSSTG